MEWRNTPGKKTQKHKWYHSCRNSCLHQKRIKVKSGISLYYDVPGPYSGAYVSLLAPGKAGYTACHPRKTTTYILHVVLITMHTHVRLKSLGKKKRKEQRRQRRKDNKRKRKRRGKEKKRKDKKRKQGKERNKKRTSRPLLIYYDVVSCQWHKPNTGQQQSVLYILIVTVVAPTYSCITCSFSLRY